MSENKYVKEAVEVLKDKSLIIAMEECSELQKELSKHLRGKGDINNLSEEIADVLITIEWIKYYFSISDYKIQAHKEIKKARIKQRLSEGNLS